METEFLRIWLSLQHFWDLVGTQITLMWLPSRRLQLVIIAVCYVAAWALRLVLAPRLHAWLHAREGWPKWRLRAMVVVQKRLQLIFLAALLWAATGAMRAIFFFPSRSYLIELAATIALALLLVSVVARLIRNVAVRRLVMWGVGAWITLYYVGLIEETTATLDGLAISAGNFRMSVLTVIEALVVTGALFMLARFLSRVAAERIQANEKISPSVQVLSVKLLQIGFLEPITSTRLPSVINTPVSSPRPIPIQPGLLATA
jgi:hypothetical protein